MNSDHSISPEHDLESSSKRQQSSSRSDTSRNERKRHSSRSRSRSKRSRSKTIQEDEKRQQHIGSKSKTHTSHNHEITDEVIGATEHVRKKRRTRRSHDIHRDKVKETPITAVLQELRDDIQDDCSDTCDYNQRAYSGGDEHDYDLWRNKDNIFVEHLHGFSSLSRDQALGVHGIKSSSANLNLSWWDKNASTAISVAILVQKMWLPIANFCHGLLAGLTLMQTILVDQLISLEKARGFINLYSQFSVTFTTLFYFLICICLVSVFDRLDLKNGDWPYLLDILSARPRVSWLLVPLYVCGLLLSLAAARTDDWIYLSQYRLSAANGSQLEISEDEFEGLSSWHVLNSLRCVCVVVGWLVIATSHPPDLLLRRLTSMLSGREPDSKQSIVQETH